MGQNVEPFKKINADVEPLKPSEAAKLVYDPLPQPWTSKQLINKLDKACVSHCQGVGFIAAIIGFSIPFSVSVFSGDLSMRMMGYSFGTALITYLVAFYLTFLSFKNKAVMERSQYIEDYNNRREQVLLHAHYDTEYQQMIEMAVSADNDRELVTVDRMFEDRLESITKKKLFNKLNISPALPAITASSRLSGDVQDRIIK